MKYKGLIILGILILVTPLIISQLIYQQNTRVNLNLPCAFNGSFCTEIAVCNVSIEYPNGSLIIDNYLMTNTGNGKPNITLPDSSVIGSYHGFYACCQSGYCDDDDFEFEITPTGKSRVNTGEGLIHILLTLFIFLLFVFVLFINIAIPYSNQADKFGGIIKITKYKYFKIMLVPLTHALFNWFLNLLLNISDNLLGDYNVYYGMISFLTETSIKLAWPIIVVTLVWAMIEWMRDFEWNKQIKKFGRVVR